VTTRAVLLDALGTIVELEPPWTHLAAELGIEPDRRLVGALRKEMDYYAAHAHEGSDPAALADLRARCAALLSRELDREVGAEQMMAAIRFRAYPDAAPALAALRRRGLALVCVSNWDYSLPEVLARCGLAGALDGVVTSAGSGARKPDPAIFAAALALARCESAEALHVGDSPDEDLAGAKAAGIRAILIDRDGDGEIASLTEIEDHLTP
jgi:putative hydrolase of the HAD superfamily